MAQLGRCSTCALFSRPLAVALVVLGIVLAVPPAFVQRASSICGVSGCSGGGFGRSTDPGQTQLLLLATGVAAALPVAVYAVARRSVRLIGAAVLVAVVAVVTAGLAIGSDLRGCPRNVSTSTCLQESR